MANQTTVSQYIDGRPSLDIDTNKTLAITDCGVVQNVIADAITITLPSTVVGYSFTIRNGGVKKTSAPRGTGDDGSVLVSVSPAAADMIVGLTVAGVDNKDAQNTKLTAKVGDEITVVGDGVNGWMVTSVKGIWTKEA